MKKDPFEHRPKVTIKKKFNSLSSRFYAMKTAAAINGGSMAMTTFMLAPLFAIDPTGTAFIIAFSGVTAGAMTGLPAAMLDVVHDTQPTVWLMRSGQKVSGPAYIRRQSEILQDAIIELNEKRALASDKEAARINKILKQYGKYIQVMSRKVQIVDPGPYGGSDRVLSFVKRSEPLQPPARRFKK